MALKKVDITTPRPDGNFGEPPKVAWEKMNENTDEIEVRLQIGEAGGASGNLALQRVTALEGELGDAAFKPASDFANAQQGVKADTAVQPAALTEFSNATNQRIDNLQASMGNAMIPYPTAASLPAADPGESKRLAWVWNDSDATKNGAWVWDGARNAFVKSADQQSLVAGEVVRVSSRQGGLDVMFHHPNALKDSDFITLLSVATGTTVDGVTYLKGAGSVLTRAIAPDGRPAFGFSLSGPSNGFVGWDVPAGTLGGVCSASLRILSGTAAGQTRLMLQQLEASGAEIQDRRQSRSVPAGSVAETLLVFENVAIAPTAAFVRLWLDSNNPGTVLVLTDALLSSGESSRYRPDWQVPVGGLVAKGVDLAVAKSAASQSESFSNPNLIAVGTFDFSAASPLVMGTLASALSDGVRSWRQRYQAGAGAVENAVEFGPFPASRFPSGRVSAGVSLVSADAAPAGYVRVLLRQFNGASEITSVRQTYRFTTTAAVTTEMLASFPAVPLDPACTSIRLYLGVQGENSASRDAYWRNPVVADGYSAAWRAPSPNPIDPVVPTAPRVVYVSPTGSNSNSGAEGFPLSTLSAALTMLNGDGTVYVMPGVYGSAMRLNSPLVTGNVSIIGVRSSISAGNYGWPTVALGDRVTGITKTSGRAKVYQAAVSGLPSLANFQWAYQHGVADPTTAIDPQYRFPQHRGRTNRLSMCARLLKTTAVVLADALAEIDVSETPKSFIDGGILYFSIVGGGDATAADIRLDSNVGMVTPPVRGAAGSLRIVGLNIMYGGLNLSGFKTAELDEVQVTGARNNAIDYNVLRYGTLEVCCAGSQSENTGDGLNGHYGAVLIGEGDLYAHDNWDDGWSAHEGCTSRINGGLVEYNGGTGMAPAYGDDSVIQNVISVRNQRRGTHKAASFYVTAPPSSATPPETGVDTNTLFINCVDYESLTSFADDFRRTDGAQPVTALCVGCKSIRPVTMGFNVRKIVDCGYLAGEASSARNPNTLVENTTLIA